MASTPIRRSWLLFGALVAAAPAHALQPLSAFVDSAREHNPDNAEAAAGLAAQQAQADVNLGRLLPALQARGIYTRNQVQVGPIGPIPGLIPAPIYIQRYDQLDAFITTSVPLIDLAGIERFTASRNASDAAEQQREATGLQVTALVTQDFFQVVANQALVAASERALEVAKTNQQLTQVRYESGKGAVLEVDRANAEVERQTQQLEAAKLLVSLSARALESASGLTPDLSAPLPLEDDLHAEPPLAQFERPDDELPAISAATTARLSAERQARAQRFSLVPSLTGAFTEHGTNAPSFIGQGWYYIAALNLSWQLDYATFAAIRGQDAAADAARAREQRTRLLVHDSIHRAWATIDAAIARSRSARAQQKASAHAAQLAQDRYEAGAATQLDLLSAQRDAFEADVARIQADADLANARLQLRLAAGTDPFATKGTP